MSGEYALANRALLAVYLSVIVYCIAYPVLEQWRITVPSACRGEVYCKSEGLSRSLARAVRGDFRNANSYNRYGVVIFFFFFAQVLLRLLLAIFFRLRRVRQIKPLVVADIVFSSVHFLVAFTPLLPLELL